MRRGCAPQLAGYGDFRCDVETEHSPRVCEYCPADTRVIFVFFLKGERDSPSFRRNAGPSHRRHVRTIQEVRTTITRIITDVYYEDGKEVERKVSEVTNRRYVALVFGVKSYETY